MPSLIPKTLDARGIPKCWDLHLYYSHTQPYTYTLINDNIDVINGGFPTKQVQTLPILKFSFFDIQKNIQLEGNGKK